MEVVLIKMLGTFGIKMPLVIFQNTVEALISTYPWDAKNVHNWSRPLMRMVLVSSH